METLLRVKTYKRILLVLWCFAVFTAQVMADDIRWKNETIQKDGLATHP